MTPNTPAAPALIETARARAAGPALFRAVRASRDRSLVAFGAALLTAFALQAGAFLPRLAPEPASAARTVEPSREPAAPAFVAARRAVAAEPAREAALVPCETPAASL